jgi:hypothetical protein
VKTTVGTLSVIKLAFYWTKGEEPRAGDAKMHREEVLGALLEARLYLKLKEFSPQLSFNLEFNRCSTSWI